MVSRLKWLNLLLPWRKLPCCSQELFRPEGETTAWEGCQPYREWWIGWWNCSKPPLRISCEPSYQQLIALANWEDLEKEKCWGTRPKQLWGTRMKLFHWPFGPHSCRPDMWSVCWRKALVWRWEMGLGSGFGCNQCDWIQVTYLPRSQLILIPPAQKSISVVERFTVLWELMD